VQLKVLQIGVDKPDELLDSSSLKNILKATLPHHTKWIDEHEPQSYYYLLDEVERYLLIELRKLLEGKEGDQAATEKARLITDALRESKKKQAENVAQEVQS